MNFFSSNYIQIRNDSLIPLIEYGIKRSKIGFWSFKEILTTKLLSLNKLSGNAIQLTISPEDYYRALHSEIELFLNKSIVQYADLKKQGRISQTWSFVTIYYFTFFTATCLFRFLNRGFIFLTREHISNLEKYSLAVYSAPLSLGTGNYYFSLDGKDEYGNLVINMSSKSDNVHKSTWIQLETILKEFSRRSNGDEKTLIDLLLGHFLSFKSEYPSSLRNKLNYNGESSILDIEERLSYVDVFKNLDTNFLKGLLTVNMKSQSENSQMACIGYLASYLFKLNINLYDEYLSRSSFGKDFQRERKKYLQDRNVELY